MTSTLVYDIRQSRYLNITGRCTLRCQFCPKHNGSKQVHQYQLDLKHQPTAEEVIALLGEVKDYDEYVFCGYGEPTLNLTTLLKVAAEIKHRAVRSGSIPTGSVICFIGAISCLSWPR